MEVIEISVKEMDASDIQLYRKETISYYMVVEKREV